MIQQEQESSALSAGAKDQNTVELSVTEENQGESFILFECLSLPQSSPSLSSSFLDDLDFYLQCNTGDVDIKTQKSGIYFIDPCHINEETLVSAEVSMLSKNDSNSMSKLSQAEAICAETKTDANGDPNHNLSSIGINSHFDNRLCCNLCDVQFSSDQALNSHIKDKHTLKEETSKFICLICSKTLRNEQSFKRHIKTHDRKSLLNNVDADGQQETSMNSCTLCSHVSKTKRLLKDHMLRKHNKDRKIFRCNRCSFSCLKPETLSLHILRHDIEPKFACDQCGKLYLTMSILKRHANTHIKTRQYSCHVPHCGKSFSMKGRLTDHVRKVHKTKKASERSMQKRQKRNTTSSLSGQNLLSNSKRKFRKKKVGPKDFKRFNQFNASSSTNNKLKFDNFELRDTCIFVYDVVLPENEIEHFQNLRTSSQSHLKSQAPDHQKVLLKLNPPEPPSDFKREGKLPQNSSKKEHSARFNTCLRGDAFSICVDEQSTCTDNDNNQKANFFCSWTNCGKKFRDNYNLRMHMFTHTGEMQRVCTLCRYMCVQKSALDSHMLKHIKKNKNHQ